MGHCAFEYASANQNSPTPIEVPLSCKHIGRANLLASRSAIIGFSQAGSLFSQQKTLCN